MRSGTHIDYQLRLYGVPLYWRTLIELWQPPYRFVDVQIRGPYRLWHHTHEFTPIGTGTRMVDVVEYEIPWGPLGQVARRLFVTAALDRIFDYRAQIIAKKFGSR